MKIWSKKIFLIAYFILCIYSAWGQQSRTAQLDSLKSALITQKEDSDKVMLLLDISNRIPAIDTQAKDHYASLALELSKKIQWETGEMMAYLALGTICQMCTNANKFNEAIRYFENGKEIAKKINNKTVEIKLLGTIAENYRKLNQYSKAISYFKQALDIATGEEYKVGILGNMGNAYSDLGDYSLALGCFQKALAIQEKSISTTKNADQLDSATYALLLVTIGNVYTTASQYDNALANYENAEKINQQLHNKFLDIETYSSIGKLYALKKNYDTAISYYLHVLDLCTELEEQSDLADIRNRLANIYIETGDLKKAMEEATQSLEIAERINNNRQLCETYITLGRINTLLKNNDKAIKYLQDALVIAKDIGLLENESKAWQQLSIIYKQIHQPEKALEAYQDYIKTRDSVYSQEKAKEITRMEMQGVYDKEKLAVSIKNETARNALNFKLQKQRIFTYSGFGGLVLLVLLSVLIYRNYNSEKKANRIIQREKEKSDELLLNILPAEVAEELKTKGSVQAKEFEHVTVMFTDFVNFTAAGERMGAQALVNELDACFVAFDEIIAKYNVEKIKTVGDAYLAVSGMPLANMKHAENMVRAATEIRDYMLERKKEKGGQTFEVRIGIHSGPVVAGIVGVRKFAYDIWGDTVNVAARMEQGGAPGKVNISDVTYELVKDHFSCTYRGELDAKNKGKMKMYFVG